MISRAAYEECLRSCIANAEQAEQRLAIVKADFAKLPAGDDKLPALRHNISQAVAESKHWRSLVLWYRQELGRAGVAPEDLPPISRPPSASLASAAPARLPYRDDDDSDDELPAVEPEKLDEPDSGADFEGAQA